MLSIYCVTALICSSLLIPGITSDLSCLVFQKTSLYTTRLRSVPYGLICSLTTLTAHKMTSRTTSSALKTLARNVQCSKLRPFRITPPPPVQQIRAFLGRRSTSFYTHSYPPVTYSGEIPYVPPGPGSSSSSANPGDDGCGDGHPVQGKRKERKERYLESLMDKAGELSLRCKACSYHQVIIMSDDSRLYTRL